MTIHYLIGDASIPSVTGNKIIVHICNDCGKWGKGFVQSISKRWKAPEQVYRLAFKSSQKPCLGDVQFIAVETCIIVANIIGQNGIRIPTDTVIPPPIRYPAVRQGLLLVADYALQHEASVHMPRIGCGLAGGSWEVIEPLMIEAFVIKNINVYVYDLKNQNFSTNL